MNHDAHDHNPAGSIGQRGLYFAAGIMLVYAVIEAGTGWWANSLALMSDAGHMLADTSALLIAALGAWLAQRAPSSRHSYGLGRAEFIAALVNGLPMLAVVSVVAIHAIERLQQPLAVKGEAVSVVAFIGLLREALHGLMEGVPLGLSLSAIGNEMAGRPGALSVHDLHI